MSIESPKMIYKIWRQDTSYDPLDRVPPSTVSTLVATTPEAKYVVNFLEFDKWMKVTYEIDTTPEHDPFAR